MDVGTITLLERGSTLSLYDAIDAEDHGANTSFRAFTASDVKQADDKNRQTTKTGRRQKQTDDKNGQILKKVEEPLNIS